MDAKRLWPIYIVVFVDILGYTIIIPVLPFLAQSLGASEWVVGTLVSSFAIAQFLSGPVLGNLSDRFGRKPILFISQVGTFLSFLLLGFTQRLELVFLARIFDGLTAGNLVVAQAAISDSTPAGQRFKAFGFIGIAFGLGFFIGPMISGLVSHQGYALPAFIAAGLSLLSILLTIFLFSETHPPAARAKDVKLKISPLPLREFRELMGLPGVPRLMLSFFLFNFAFSGVIVGLPLVLERKVTWDGVAFNAQHVGWFYAYLGLLGILVQTRLLGWAVGRFGERGAARMGALFQGLGVAFYALVDRFSLAFVGSTLSSIGSGFVRPTVTSLLTQSVGRDRQGQVLGLSQAVASIGTIAAPLISGALIGTQMIWAWALFFGASAAMGFVFSRAR